MPSKQTSPSLISIEDDFLHILSLYILKDMQTDPSLELWHNRFLLAVWSAYLHDIDFETPLVEFVDLMVPLSLSIESVYSLGTLTFVKETYLHRHQALEVTDELIRRLPSS
jgi:hypothetical protein